ncbi:MAG: NAD+ synthase [Bacteroidetes bacterium]|nr:NAD+ synthase [Bacteroidota bacterium]
MKIALCQLNYKVGDIDANFKKISDFYSKAVSENADLAVFSELSICGYPPQDLLDYDFFINKCKNAIDKLVEISGKTSMIVGCPMPSRLNSGKKLYNSAVLIQNNKIMGVFNKTLLPTYNIFDEYRYFEPCEKYSIAEINGHKFAITVCEDLWDINTSKLYRTSPMEHLSKLDPELIINISGSPFSYNHVEERTELMKKNALKYNLPLIYVNQTGANTDIIFDGGSMFIDSKGNVISQLEYFKEDFKIIEWEKNKKYLPAHKNYKNDDIILIYEALKLGIKDFFEKSGFSKAILGLSGGIDSALVTVLAKEVLGSANVLPVLLPSVFSSAHSIDDSIKLCKNLNIKYELIEISSIVDSFEKQLKPVFKNSLRNVAEENIQSRVRGTLLMAISNKTGHILLNTTNKSEAAVGYGTLYGDMCGAISVLGDVYKTQIYKLAKYINRNVEIIPQNIIDKAPSAELRPNQKDSDTLPDYKLLDEILYLYIEKLLSIEDIITKGFDEKLVKKIIKMVDVNEFKRFQVPPILRVSDKAFGIGRQMPIVGKIN